MFTYAKQMEDYNLCQINKREKKSFILPVNGLLSPYCEGNLAE